ncbi:hypothetical protein CI102_7740 [Trichoderma harzianum]|uniref:Uncharacterized protein n=1 Tax=Trichoderma harzianum CBS 226.95 TaxID=983964 RepID=A0A2T4A376_TRIHA|nr:hypothetical protein M431DRAFT_92699 [Trichoderma harzianum CBS 226.95]PKK47345.1 hypothetical protein CI102_7740 [Trichoderma harzianum]PTB51522.1 hypothetical protein M431DRAFT_92699 [Trichoderma harzianum CBS 226.95]
MSGNKPNPVDTEQPWNGMPDDFAANGSGYSSAPRRRRGPARSSAVQNEHGGQATAPKAELKSKNEHDEWIGAADAVPTNAVDRFNPAASGIAISDEQSGEGEYTRTPEGQSLMGEEFPTLEDDKMSFPDANNNMTGLSLGLQLDVSSDESDEEDEYNAATRDNILPVDSPRLSPSIPCDDAMDGASETGNNIVHPINAESDQNSRANIDEILAELDFLKKKIESQDEMMEAMPMRQQNASLKKQLESHTERISAREAEIAALKKTTFKANPSVGVATSTKTPAGQILQPNCPRKDDDEQKVISLEKPSSSPPVSSLAARKATAVRSVQPFVAIAKDLYFDFTEAMNVGPKPSPLWDTTYIFQIWARAVITFLATPIWTLASFFMYLSVQHEKNLWMQANALTRKQLLGQVSGATEDWTADWIWDMVFIVGSVISLCRL